MWLSRGNIESRDLDVLMPCERDAVERHGLPDATVDLSPASSAVEFVDNICEGPSAI